MERFVIGQEQFDRRGNGAPKVTPRAAASCYYSYPAMSHTTQDYSVELPTMNYDDETISGLSIIRKETSSSLDDTNLTSVPTSSSPRKSVRRKSRHMMERRRRARVTMETSSSSSDYTTNECTRMGPVGAISRTGGLVPISSSSMRSICLPLAPANTPDTSSTSNQSSADVTATSRHLRHTSRNISGMSHSSSTSRYLSGTSQHSTCSNSGGSAPYNTEEEEEGDVSLSVLGERPPCIGQESDPVVEVQGAPAPSPRVSGRVEVERSYPRGLSRAAPYPSLSTTAASDATFFMDAPLHHPAVTRKTKSASSSHVSRRKILSRKIKNFGRQIQKNVTTLAIV